MTSARDVIERHLNQKAGLVLTSEANADAILAALDAAGYAVVPKEMTDAHYMDAHTNYPYCVAAHPKERGTCQEKTKALYAAAITAAKETT